MAIINPMLTQSKNGNPKSYVYPILKNGNPMFPRSLNPEEWKSYVYPILKNGYPMFTMNLKFWESYGSLNFGNPMLSPLSKVCESYVFTYDPPWSMFTMNLKFWESYGSLNFGNPMFSPLSKVCESYVFALGSTTIQSEHRNVDTDALFMHMIWYAFSSIERGNKHGLHRFLICILHSILHLHTCILILHLHIALLKVSCTHVYQDSRNIKMPVCKVSILKPLKRNIRYGCLLGEPHMINLWIEIDMKFTYDEW
jgi:hypothetical protein